MEAVAPFVVDAASMAVQQWMRWSPGRLVALRQVLKLSPEQMAAEVGSRTGEQIAGNSIRRWESGRHFPNVKHLVAIANAFEVEITLFFEPDEKPAPKKRSPKH